MVHRGGGKLAPVFTGELPVLIDDPPHHFDLVIEHIMLLPLRESASLAPKAGEFGVLVPEQRMEPGQIEQGGEICVLRGSVPAGYAVIPPQCAKRRFVPAKEVGVTRLRENHRRGVGGEEVPEEELVLLLREIEGVLAGYREEDVLRAVFHVIPDLDEKRRNEVDRVPNARVSAENPRKRRVILDRVKPDPREEVGSRFRVLVIRLVHVPEETDPKFHQRNAPGRDITLSAPAGFRPGPEGGFPGFP